MSCSSKWHILTRVNKVIFILTLVALCLLVLGFSTPFWISISVETNFHSKRNFYFYLLFEPYEEEYVGLWQWCFKQYGCFDLSLFAQFFSTFTNKTHIDGTEGIIIYKTNRIINLWAVSRSFTTVAVVCAISFLIWKLYFIWIRKMNHVRIYHIVSIVENFIIGSALIVCLATFVVAIQTFDELMMDMISGWNIDKFLEINRYFFISSWMVSAATLLYFCNGILAVVSLYRCYMINTKAAYGRRSVATTGSGWSEPWG